MVEAVYTAPPSRGRGYGEKVLRAAVERGREYGQDKCWITCAVGNTPAHRLYERIGFGLIGAGNSKLCLEKIGTPGFEVLEIKY